MESEAERASGDEYASSLETSRRAGTYIEKSGIALAGKVRDFYTHLHLSFTLNKTETQDEADGQMRYTVLKPDSSKAPSRPPHPLLRQDGGMRTRAGTQCNPLWM